MVQWLGLCTLTAKAPGSIPGQGTKIPQAALGGGGKKKNKKKRAKAISQVCLLPPILDISPVSCTAGRLTG